jgi:hypothetical protein
MAIQEPTIMVTMSNKIIQLSKTVLSGAIIITLCHHKRTYIYHKIDAL